MEEQKMFYVPNTKMTGLARELSSFSKNIGDVGFSIKYPATESNILIHEEFIRFAFSECNGDYIVAIGKLLTNSKINSRINMLEDRISTLEVMFIDLATDLKDKELSIKESEVKKDVKKELKVF